MIFALIIAWYNAFCALNKRVHEKQTKNDSALNRDDTTELYTIIYETGRISAKQFNELYEKGYFENARFK